MRPATTFWRLFAAFVAANLLVASLSILATRWLVERQDFSLRNLDDIASEVARDWDPASLRWLDRLQRRVRDEQGAMLFVLQDGRPIMDRPPMPPPVRDWLGRLGSTPRTDVTLRNGERLLATASSVPGGADVRVVLFRPPGPRPSLSVPMLLLIQVLISLAVIAAAGAWIARQLAAPVRGVQSALRRIASGELATRVDSAIAVRRDEFGDLARDVDSMTTRLQSLLADRDRLLHDVSHELRSPLARLRLLLELARVRPAGSADALAQGDREIDRMEQLVDEVLAAQRAGRSDLALELESIELREFVLECLEAAQVEADAHPVRLTLMPADPLVPAESGEARLEVEANRELLARAVDNVLRNAIRFSPRDGTISVQARIAPGHRELVEVMVQDEGAGVPEAYLSRLFEPFFRVPCAATSARDGSGLGLSIVERAMHAHGGHASAANAPRGGLRITLALPRKKR
jgi:two-component system, OmpR family, sensor kinase